MANFNVSFNSEIPEGIPLPGNTPSMTSGSVIHALCYTISLGILILQTRWILPPRKFMMRMVNVDMRTLCQLID